MIHRIFRERGIKSFTMVIMLSAILALTAGACGGEPDQSSTGETTGENTQQDDLSPAEATVGPDESSAMMPAGGEEPDPAQPPPENPPRGVETFEAGTNDIVDGEVDYERTPPTNGDHAALWQNCGFYDEPVRDENAVHSLDHGAVWITYDPEIPQEEIETLRPYGEQRYVLISPYPDQPAPVIATSWRNQLRLEDAQDPRLEQFVEQFRVSETAPLSGNGCTGGFGEPLS